MTPKEKAVELIESFGRSSALICVDETAKNSKLLITIYMSEYTDKMNYWKEVKQEIEKL